MVIGAIVLQGFLTLYYLFSGSAKIVGAKYWTAMFEHLKLPQWFRVVAGVVQLIGAAVLIIGYWNVGVIAWASIWLGVTMLVACLFHVRMKDPIGKLGPAVLFAVLNIALVTLTAGNLILPFA